MCSPRLPCGFPSPLSSEHSPMFSFWSCSNLWILLITDELQRPWSWGSIQLLSPGAWSSGVSRTAKESSRVLRRFWNVGLYPRGTLSGKQPREDTSEPFKKGSRGKRTKIGKGSRRRDGCALHFCLPIDGIPQINGALCECEQRGKSWGQN